jgi:predicted MFS family arabinose efflux permease
MSASDEQGEMFGWLEGGRGVLGLVISLGGLQLYRILGAGTYDVRAVILAVSAICIVAGILVLAIVPELESEKSDDTGKITAKLVLKVLKMPGTWIAAAAIFMTYVFVGGGSYLNPYLEQGFGLTAVMAGSISAIRAEGTKIISGPVFGNISKKLGRSTGILCISFLVLAALSVVLLVAPTTSALLVPMIVVVIVVGFFSYGNRGVYWALIDEFQTPKYMVGTMVGVVSIIGFIPDAFLYSIFGAIMDHNPGIPGLRMIFGIFLGCAVFGFVCFLFGERIVKRLQAGKQTGGTHG